MDKHGKIHISHVSTDTERDRPEIDRKVLRKLLLESVSGDAARWDHKLRRVSGPREDGCYVLEFVGREEQVAAGMVVGLMELDALFLSEAIVNDRGDLKGGLESMKQTCLRE